MKTKQLFIPILLLAFSACKKDLATTESANAMLQSKASLNTRSFVSSIASDQYKISGITTTYAPMGNSVFRTEQSTYTYTSNGKLNRIITVRTIKTKRPRVPLTNPVIYDTVAVTNNDIFDYTYGVNTVKAKYQFSSNTAASHWESTYVLDNQGEVIKDTVKIFNAITGSVSTTPNLYTYTTVNATAKTIDVSEPNYSFRYNLTNDNLLNILEGGGTTQILSATYGFYTDKVNQPADALSLNQQLSPYGYASINSKNLSQSASANTNLSYSAMFGTAYGIGDDGSCADVKFTYEFDSAGRITKITETGRANHNISAPYRLLKTRVINYVSN